MKISNKLVRLPEMSAAMREMSGELMKAGILEEMMDDTLEASAMDTREDIEALSLIHISEPTRRS